MSEQDEIDHLNSVIADYGDDCAEMQRGNDILRARVAELEADNKKLKMDAAKMRDGCTEEEYIRDRETIARLRQELGQARATQCDCGAKA